MRGKRLGLRFILVKLSHFVRGQRTIVNADVVNYSVKGRVLWKDRDIRPAYSEV